jgi:hypothetical protein
MDPTIPIKNIIKGIQQAVKGETVDAVIIPVQARSRFSDDSIVAYKYAEALLQSI